jgi:DNA-directed RNA polymerase specialized sigma24 family protein
MVAEIDLDRFRSALLLLARAQVARQRCLDIEPSDLVQQTLLEAHRDRHQCTGKTDEARFAWLRKVLRHTLLDACDRAHAGKRAPSRKALEADLTQSFIGLDELLVAPTRLLPSGPCATSNSRGSPRPWNGCRRSSSKRCSSSTSPD